jgi:hypothetical protein
MMMLFAVVACGFGWVFSYLGTRLLWLASSPEVKLTLPVLPRPVLLHDLQQQRHEWAGDLRTAS